MNNVNTFGYGSKKINYPKGQETTGRQVDVTIPLASTPPGMPGTHPLQYFGWWGRQWEYPHQYYDVRSDIADQY